MIGASHHCSIRYPQANVSARSIVINHVAETIRGKRVAIAYVYCDYKDVKTQSEVELLCSITRQLAEQIRPLPPEVKTFHDKNIQERRNPTNNERISLLRSICLHFQATYVFIDALVEIPLLDYFHNFERLTLQNRTYALKRTEKSFFV